MPPTLGVGALRAQNNRKLLDALRAGGGQTVSELAEATQTSRPTVQAGLAELTRQKLVIRTATPATSGRLGRPAHLVSFNADAGRLVGVQLDRDSLTVHLADLNGRVTGRQTTSADLHTARAAHRAVDRAIRACLRAEGRADSDVWAIALGVPGIIDADGTYVLSTVVPDWVRSGLQGALRSSWPDAELIFERDATMVAIDAAARTGRDTVVAVLAGDRIGAGVVLGGLVLRGRHGAAAEIGAASWLRWSDASDRLLESAGTPTSAAALDTGPGALSAPVRRFADDVARGVAVLVLAFDPDLVTIAGPARLAGEAFLDRVRRRVSKSSLFETEITFSDGEDVVVATGAIERARQAIDDHLARVLRA